MRVGLVLYACVHVSTSVCALFFFFVGSGFRRNPVIPPAALFRNVSFFFRFAVAVKRCGLFVCFKYILGIP